MTSNEDHNNFMQQLEPAVAQLSRAVMRFESETVVQVSIAISLKRIADALDHICNYGVISGEH